VSTCDEAVMSGVGGDEGSAVEREVASGLGLEVPPMCPTVFCPRGSGGGGEETALRDMKSAERCLEEGTHSIVRS